MLEALLVSQPEWVSHSGPDLDRAWQAAAVVGLELERARRDATADEASALLAVETEDADTWQVD